jgi:hypothetical protein
MVISLTEGVFMDNDDKRDGTLHGSDPKKWVKPELRRLPIAATAGTTVFNEGKGKGKGEAGDENPS